MILIGLTGLKQSGKDTAAGFMVKEWGFKRFAYADALKDFLYAQNPLVAFLRPGHSISKFLRLADVVDEIGWDGAKNQRDIRGLLQRTGTEAARGVFGDRFWLDILNKKIDQSKHNRIVVTDCRFPNEVHNIRVAGGVVWRISRPGTDIEDQHGSERLIPELDVDLEINNNGTIPELHTFVHRELNRVFYGQRSPA